MERESIMQAMRLFAPANNVTIISPCSLEMIEIGADPEDSTGSARGVRSKVMTGVLQ